MSTPSHIPVRDERDALLLKYEPLLFQQANYWHHRFPTVGHDDLMQTGRLALLRAWELYDSMKGAAFMTYAHRRITADMSYCVSRTRDTIRVPREHRNIRFITVSFELPVGDDDGRTLTLGETLAEAEPMTMRLLDQVDACTLLAPAIARLKPKQREIIQRLYLTETPQTSREIAKEMGVTRQAVEKHVKKAFRMLRRNTVLKGAA